MNNPLLPQTPGNCLSQYGVIKHSQVKSHPSFQGKREWLLQTWHEDYRKQYDRNRVASSWDILLLHIRIKTMPSREKRGWQALQKQRKKCFCSIHSVHYFHRTRILCAGTDLRMKLNLNYLIYTIFSIFRPVRGTGSQERATDKSTYLPFGLTPTQIKTAAVHSDFIIKWSVTFIPFWPFRQSHQSHSNLYSSVIQKNCQEVLKLNPPHSSCQENFLVMHIA